MHSFLREQESLLKQKSIYETECANLVGTLSMVIQLHIEHLVNERKKTGYMLDMRSNLQSGTSSVGGKVEVYQYILIEIFSPERAHEGLSRDLYVAIFPVDLTVSLVIDGEKIVTKAPICTHLKSVYSHVEEKINTMGLMSVKAST